MTDCCWTDGGKADLAYSVQSGTPSEDSPEVGVAKRIAFGWGVGWRRWEEKERGYHEGELELFESLGVMAAMGR